LNLGHTLSSDFFDIIQQLTYQCFLGLPTVSLLEVFLGMLQMLKPVDILRFLFSGLWRRVVSQAHSYSSPQVSQTSRYCYVFTCSEYGVIGENALVL
jgi:hypothetical protein